MTVEHAAQALQGVAAFMALGLFAYGPWQWICVDRARQKMFNRRDDLFDLALSGKLAFNSTEYEEIRDAINAMIRFAHGLTWVRIVLMRVFVFGGRGRLNNPVTAAVSRIHDRRVRGEVSAILNDVRLASFELVIYRAPLLVLTCIFTVLPAIIIGIACVSARDFLKTSAEDIGNLIQIEAQAVVVTRVRLA